MRFFPIVNFSIDFEISAPPSFELFEKSRLQLSRASRICLTHLLFFKMVFALAHDLRWGRGKARTAPLRSKCLFASKLPGFLPSSGSCPPKVLSNQDIRCQLAVRTARALHRSTACLRASIHLPEAQTHAFSAINQRAKSKHALHP